MLSTLVELVGFGLIIAATAVHFGLWPALYVGGVVALLVGYAVEDTRVAGVWLRPRRWVGTPARVIRARVAAGK